MLGLSLKKGNLINANCALAAPPHYPPLVEPLRPGPTLVTHTPPTLFSNLLSVSPTPACTLFFFFFALLPAVLLLPLLPVPGERGTLKEIHNTQSVSARAPGAGPGP